MLVENLFQTLLKYVYLSSACIMSSKRKKNSACITLDKIGYMLHQKKKDW